MANTIEVKVPDIGGFDDVPVIEVLVAVGDEVAKDQGLVTLESDKATMEVPAAADGVVKALKVALGDKVSEGANRLIFDGAYPFISMESFFGTQPGQGSLFAEGAKIAAPKAADFPPDEAAVMSALWNCGGKTVDNIALEVKMSAADVLKTIAVLSAKGAVYSSGPGRYSAKV